MRESRQTELERFRGCSTQAEYVKIAIWSTVLTDSVDRIHGANPLVYLLVLILNRVVLSFFNF